MNGQNYLYDYFKTCRRYKYYIDLIRKYKIRDDNDREQCYLMINCACDLALEVLYAFSDAKRELYLNELVAIDRELRKYIICILEVRRAIRFIEEGY